MVGPVSACDLISYLVLQTSFITSKQFKAYKSLEQFNLFVESVQTHAYRLGKVCDYRTGK